MRPVNLDLGADGQIGKVGQVIGEKTFFDPVHAQLKAVAHGCRSDRVSAGLHLALRVLSHGGDKLAGSIGKALQLVNDKDEVVALCDFRDADFAFETRGIKFTCQGFLAGEEMGAQKTDYREYRQRRVMLASRGSTLNGIMRREIPPEY